MAFNKYGIAETTKVKSVISGHIFSLKNNTTDIQNGWFVHKGNLLAGEREIYEAVIPSTASVKTTPVAFVANPAWDYDESRSINQNVSSFINKMGVSFRAYDIENNDLVAVSDYTIDKGALTELAVGNYVTAKNSGGIVASAAKPDAAFIGKIIDFDVKGYAIPTGSAGVIDNNTRLAIIEVVQNNEVTPAP